MCISKLQHLLKMPTNSEITNQPLPLLYSRSMKVSNLRFLVVLPMLCLLIYLIIVIKLSICFYPFLSSTTTGIIPDVVVVVDTVGPPNKDSIKTLIAIPTAVNMDTVVIYPIP